MYIYIPINIHRTLCRSEFFVVLNLTVQLLVSLWQTAKDKADRLRIE
jgi:hypothetical protein